MKHWDVIINPDGSVESLYTDKMPWKDIGEIEVERVSDVPFDAEEQNFRVVDLEGNPLIETDERFEKRGDAVEAEIKHFFGKMNNGKTKP